MHPFEKAGLGKPPYRVTGVEQKVGPIVSYDRGMRVEVGAPGQPMGCCMYCSTGIKDCYWITPAEGEPFYVGSECVRKAAKQGGDTDLKRQLNKLKNEQRKSRERERIEEAQNLVNDPEIRAQLEEVKIPTPWGGEQSFMDQFNWYMQHAGNAGKIKMVRKLERIRKELDNASN